MCLCYEGDHLSSSGSRVGVPKCVKKSSIVRKFTPLLWFGLSVRLITNCDAFCIGVLAELQKYRHKESMVENTRIARKNV